MNQTVVIIKGVLCHTSIVAEREMKTAGLREHTIACSTERSHRPSRSSSGYSPTSLLQSTSLFPDSSCEIYGWQSGIATAFFPSTSVFRESYHCTSAVYISKCHPEV